MTEDILFDNIYIGHSIDDAKAFAAETFDVKHALEEAANKAAFPEDEGEQDEITFTENPVEFLRNKAFKFIALARVDPVVAFKTHPETGVALAGALLTFCGMLGALFGLVGSQQKTVTKVGFLPMNHLHQLIMYSCSLRRKPMHLLPMTRTLRRRPLLRPRAKRKLKTLR
jgi:hypothetical protein